MRNGKILVTGGAGFIGSHLVTELARRGYLIKVLDNLSTGKLSNISSDLLTANVEFVQGDIRDSRVVQECVAKVDAVVHHAAQTSVPFSIQNPDFNNDVNIGGTSNLLHTSVESNLAKFIFISSCAVYGDPALLPVDEQQKPDPISPYAQSKHVAEQECMRLDQKHSLNCVVLRLFNVYGPRQGLSEYSGVITKFIDRIKQGLPLIIYGDGSQTRDFVYVRDVVEAVLLALGNRKAEGEVFNVGTGRATSIQELAETMLSLTGAKLGIVKAPARQGDIKESYADISKANRLLAYKPKFLLKDGLKDLLTASGF